MDQLELFIDPVCPWTWLSARWLWAVEREVWLVVRMSFVSLLELNREDSANPWLVTMREGRRAQRVMAALRAAGDEARIVELYRRIGALTFEVGRVLEAGVLAEALAAAGVPSELRAAADDERLDAAVLAEHQRAMALAGPDVGSPVLARLGGDRGFYGPIVDRPLVGEDALRVWGVVSAALETPAFFELKRGRGGEPRFA